MRHREDGRGGGHPLPIPSPNIARDETIRSVNQSIEYSQRERERERERDTSSRQHALTLPERSRDRTIVSRRENSMKRGGGGHNKRGEKEKNNQNRNNKYSSNKQRLIRYDYAFDHPFMKMTVQYFDQPITRKLNVLVSKGKGKGGNGNGGIVPGSPPSNYDENSTSFYGRLRWYKPVIIKLKRLINEINRSYER